MGDGPCGDAVHGMRARHLSVLAGDWGVDGVGSLVVRATVPSVTHSTAYGKCPPPSPMRTCWGVDERGAQ